MSCNQERTSLEGLRVSTRWQLEPPNKELGDAGWSIGKIESHSRCLALWAGFLRRVSLGRVFAIIRNRNYGLAVCTSYFGYSAKYHLKETTRPSIEVPCKE